jgi:YVTN family beta-propeller protein
VAVRPDGSRAYVTNRSSDSVSVINTSNNTVIDTVTVGSDPNGVAVSPDGSRVYVTNYDSGSVSVINTSNNTVIATVTVGAEHIAVAVSPDGSHVYLTNLYLSSVSVISAPPSVTTPSAPTALVAAPGNGSASISFTAGADGGAAISKYQYRVGTGSWTDAVGTTSPITITGLTNYANNSIRLRAVNSAAAGSASSPVSVTPRQEGPAVTAATPSGSKGIVVTFILNPLPGTTVAYQSVVAYARDTTTVKGSCRTYGKQATCYIGGLTRDTNYDLRVTAHLPVPGKTWHNTTAAGSILQVTTNR